MSGAIVLFGVTIRVFLIQAILQCIILRSSDLHLSEKSRFILSDKLDVLKWTAEADTHEGRVDDDDGPEASDDSEINSYFPFTLRYLDLSTLRLESELDRFPLVLFIVSGRPGTGEVFVSLSRRI
jgi:hypothetical protein